MNSKTKLKLTERGWIVVGWLGAIGYVGIIVLAGVMEGKL